MSTKEIIGHALLCSAAVFAIHENPSLSWISITFEILFAHGLLGLSHIYLDSPGVNNLFDITSDIVEILPLAFINTQFLLPVQQSLGYLHATSVIAPSTSNMFQYDQLDAERIENIVILGNVGTALYLGIELKNVWFIALAIITLINRFAIDTLADKLKLNRSEVLSAGLAIFCILITLCLQNL